MELTDGGAIQHQYQRMDRACGWVSESPSPFDRLLSGAQLFGTLLLEWPLVESPPHFGLGAAPPCQMRRYSQSEVVLTDIWVRRQMSQTLLGTCLEAEAVKRVERIIQGRQEPSRRQAPRDESADSGAFKAASHPSKSSPRPRAKP